MHNIVAHLYQQWRKIFMLLSGRQGGSEGTGGYPPDSEGVDAGTAEAEMSPRQGGALF
jgi:hypothetical protein